MRTILSLCDYTGAWSQPYADAGYNVVRVDIKYGDDVRLFKLPDYPVHGILAAGRGTGHCGHTARIYEQATGGTGQ